ncbi:MAG: phosphate acetyltransferase [Candidatus Bostrichicola ureolyticus]|nr:MAG: phosphate acetyltransferase [Candidatus Bostrichicola ureolyticus]
MKNYSVFITATSDTYGKYIITFGIIRMLINKKLNVAFLKPIREDIEDNYINTILSYFNMSYKESFAFTTKEEAIANYLTNKNNFFNIIINKYYNLKKKYDFIIVEGTKQTSIFDFNINNLIAQTIQIPIILIINGENKSVETIANNIFIEYDSMQKKGNKIIMIVINNSIISKQKLEVLLYNRINIDTIISIIPYNVTDLIIAIERFERYIDIILLEKRIINFKIKIVNPQLFQYNIFNISKKLQKHIVLPEGLDERILCASSKFAYNKLGLLTLLGDKEKILIKVKKLGLFWDEQRIKIINPIKYHKYEEFYKKLYELRKNKGLQYYQSKRLMLDVSYFGTMMVYNGLADGMVSGVIHTTAHTIRPALQIIKTINSIKTVSSIFLMLLYDRVIIYGDCAIVPNPTSEQLAEIAICSAITAKSLGISPKIAMLSYSSGDSGLGKEVDKVKNATIIVKNIAPELIIEGPIQYDAAVDFNVGIRKLPNSNVIGQANVFIFPDLNSGNITYKAVQRETNTIAMGPILQGIKKPINDLSRGSTVDDIYNTIIITTIQANENTNY